MRPAWKMSPAIHAAMARRAETDYPNETCGFVFRTKEGLDVHPMRNVQNELHAKDPATFGRDARTAYYFDPTEMASVLADREARGEPLAAIYHSHPDLGAYFSETDSEAAAVFGEPNFPGVVYLVYSVLKGRSEDVKAFDWSEEVSAFVEIPCEIG